MKIEHISAFSDNGIGGNPAGVVIGTALPSEDTMRKIAADLGYSETVFAARHLEGWRVRYFSPESEVPFCGHATIALGAMLAKKCGNGFFKLYLNETKISVKGTAQDDTFRATLVSPVPKSSTASPALIKDALALFGWDMDVLDLNLPPARVNAGAEHLALALKSRKTLASMRYDLDAGRTFMRDHGLVTIALINVESPQFFHVRNAFASGGVLEDPATGAAAAAFCGYLRALNWPHNQRIEIVQGEDMGMRSHIVCEFSDKLEDPIAVTGAVRIMQSAG